MVRSPRLYAGLATLLACAETDAPDAESIGSRAAYLVPAAPAGATPATGDFDGDGITDFSLKASNGYWYIDVGGNGAGGRWDYVYWNYGGSSAIPAVADYDGDGKTDLAIKDSTGFWGVDYAANHFGSWDALYWNRGDSTEIPVPADYDGDGKADLSVKTHGGLWRIDRSSVGGLAGWDLTVGGYGDATAIPVPGDYDGDKKADLAVKNAQGYWHIDTWALSGFGSWNHIYGGWGHAGWVPAPYDYDRDGRTDIAVKTDAGVWRIDWAWDGFGAANVAHGGRGGSWSTCVPGDYDGDGMVDLAVKDTSGWWLIDHAIDGVGAWNLQVHNVGRVLRNTSMPYIDSMAINASTGVEVAPGTGGAYPLTIGERYTVALRIKPGSTPNWKAGVEINPDLFVPDSLKIANRIGSTDSVAINTQHARRFVLVCTEPGNFPLGYRFRQQMTGEIPGQPFNPDYGIRVQCSSPKLGLHGQVLNRKNVDGRLMPDPSRPVPYAQVTVGASTVLANASGYWHMPNLTGGPHKIVVKEDAGHSPTIVLGVHVPAGSGFQVDTVLEERFDTLRASGIDYTLYIDYSRARTHLHVVRIDPARNFVDSRPAPVDGWVNGLPQYRKLLDLAAQGGPDALVTINGGYFTTDGTVLSDGYYHANGYVPSRPSGDGGGYPADGGGPLLEPLDQHSFLTIDGQGYGQTLAMVHASRFFENHSATWGRDASGQPILDAQPPYGQSDADVVMEVGPRLLETMPDGDKRVPWRGDISWPWFVQQWPRTTIGVAPGAFYIVVADGENVNGGQGASFHHLGEFYRDELGATDAINFDGGTSTEIILRGQNGPRRINTMTGEDSAWDKEPYTQSNYLGGVHNYLVVGP